MKRARFWECTNPDCTLRFPQVVEGEAPFLRHCPSCGAPVRLAAQATLPAEAPLPHRAPHPTPLPPATPGARLAVLDNLRSAWNVGSIFRSADGAGWRHLCLAGFTPTPEHPGVAKTALGAEQRVAWSPHPNAVRLVQRLKTQGWALWALETTPQARPLPQVRAEASAVPLALVVGNEQAGVDPDLLALCDRVVTLPMRGHKRSLNVAIAFAIAAYLLPPPGGSNHAAH